MIHNAPFYDLYQLLKQLEVLFWEVDDSQMGVVALA